MTEKTSSTTSTGSLLWKDLVPPEKHPGYKYEGFFPGKVRHLPKGHVAKPGFQAFPLDVTLEMDVAVEMQDGKNIYVDVYRPSTGPALPAIIAWSPYGKGSVESCPQNYDSMGPFRMGIPDQKLSGFETFEGPNPAEWCSRGYAVIDPDARGAGHSEGNIEFWGQQEAMDVHNLIDWASKQPWCDGNVVMFGNSWLAISQINYASRFDHPALKAIAPWEGLTDPYIEQACRGGAPAPAAFLDMIVSGFAGYNKAEDLGAMVHSHPLYDDYWRGKHISVENIKDPFEALLRQVPSTNGFVYTIPKSVSQSITRISGKEADKTSGHDLYKTENTDDLQRFYDCFAKGKSDNGWMGTPPLRLSLLSFNGSTVETINERPENSSFPLPRTQMQKFFLDGSDCSAQEAHVSKQTTISYEGHHLNDVQTFKLFFTKYTELSGYAWVKLFMSCDAKEDFDVNVQIRKIDRSGNLLAYANYPMPVPIDKVPDNNVPKYLGPTGILRASHSVSQKPKQDPDDYPSYDHRSREAIPKGKVVGLEIPIWPIGMVFDEGEGIALLVAGHSLTLQEVGPPPSVPVDENEGRHFIYTGGEYASFLMLPFITE